MGPSAFFSQLQFSLLSTWDNADCILNAGWLSYHDSILDKTFHAQCGLLHPANSFFFFHTNMYHCGPQVCLSFRCLRLLSLVVCDQQIQLCVYGAFLHKTCTTFFFFFRNFSLCQTAICNAQLVQLWPRAKCCTTREHYSNANNLSLLGHFDQGWENTTCFGFGAKQSLVCTG